jgi:putative ABC transport system permease protein
MFKVSLRSLLSHKLRLVLTAVAIILGVTFVSGTLVLTDTIRSTFEGVLSNVDKGVAVQVKGAVPATATARLLGASLPLPESVLGKVQKVSGVADAVGVLERSGVSLLNNGQVVGGTNQRSLLGINWVSDPQLTTSSGA